MELNKDLKIENSTKTLSDLLVPLDYFKFLGFETKEFKGAKWLKIYYHDSCNGTTVWSEQQLWNTFEWYRWSIMGMIPNFYNAEYGGYEFLLEYPEIKKYNRWSQTSNPMTTSQSVSGYRAIDLQMTSNDWGGLSISSSKGTNTILDGSPTVDTWYYAIGPQRGYNGGVPAGDGAIVQNVFLWIRIG